MEEVIYINPLDLLLLKWLRENQIDVGLLLLQLWVKEETSVNNN